MLSEFITLCLKKICLWLHLDEQQARSLESNSSFQLQVVLELLWFLVISWASWSQEFFHYTSEVKLFISCCWTEEVRIIVRWNNTVLKIKVQYLLFILIYQLYYKMFKMLVNFPASVISGSWICFDSQVLTKNNSKEAAWSWTVEPRVQ